MKESRGGLEMIKVIAVKGMYKGRIGVSKPPQGKWRLILFDKEKSWHAVEKENVKEIL